MAASVARTIVLHARHATSTCRYTRADALPSVSATQKLSASPLVALPGMPESRNPRNSTRSTPRIVHALRAMVAHDRFIVGMCVKDTMVLNSVSLE